MKAAVLTAGSEPGASIAAVALANGLNANLVRKWRMGRGLQRSGLSPMSASTSVASTTSSAWPSPARVADARFLPIEMAAPPTPPTPPALPVSATSPGAAATLEPLYDAHKRFILSAAVSQADENPIPILLDPGRGKAKTACVWACARGSLDPHPGVIHAFCTGRGGHFPLAFLGAQGPPYAEPAWQGTLVCDHYTGDVAAEDGWCPPPDGVPIHARLEIDTP